jgi:hypothetical protein
MGALTFAELENIEPSMDQAQVVDDSLNDYDPEGMDGFFHAAIRDGAGVLIDGEQRNRDKLIESIEAVLDKLSSNPNGGVKAARGQFLTDVCRIFKLPTTIGTGDSVDRAAVIDDLKKLPESLVEKSDEVVSRTTQPFEPMEGIPSSSVPSYDDDVDDSYGDAGEE